MLNKIKKLINEIIKKNPVFVLMLGLCPTLAVTTSIENAIGMGISTFFVLLMSGSIISIIKKFIPPNIRIPCIILIIATFVTIISLLLQAFFPIIFENLGIYIPLIVVNCIVLGRALSISYRSNLKKSLEDSFIIGTGFLIALILIGFIREIIGNGKIVFLNKTLINIPFDGLFIMILPAGALLTIGFLLAFFNYLKFRKTKI
ncbi:MAG: RnfABCDGE type electron transport complex subunit E [Nanoarchaeota archaeon]